MKRNLFPIMETLKGGGPLSGRGGGLRDRKGGPKKFSVLRRGGPPQKGLPPPNRKIEDI